MNSDAHAENDPVITVRNLTRRFGSTIALNKINLDIPRGSVFGIVGINGAGKTTLIRHFIGLLKAKEGEVNVLGFDPVRNPVEVLSRIGYVADEKDYPEWMKVSELVNFTQAFYPNWDHQYAENLIKEFRLDPSRKIRELSRGQKSRVALILALAYKPEILILDEPSSGLDPIVRSDILKAIIQTISDEGRTVIFSSHLLDEVERVSDHIVMIDQGDLLMNSRLEEMKKSFHRLVVRFREPRTSVSEFTAALDWRGQGQEWTAVCNGQLKELIEQISQADGEIVEQAVPSLNEIFFSQVNQKTLAH